MEVTQSFPPKRQLNTYDAKLPPGCTGYDQAWHFGQEKGWSKWT